MKEGGPGGFGAGRGRRAGVRSAFCLSDIFVVFGREARCSLWDKGGAPAVLNTLFPSFFFFFFKGLCAFVSACVPVRASI